MSAAADEIATMTGAKVDTLVCDLASLDSIRALRWFNEVPVLVLVAIVYLVLAKPF